MSKFSGDFSFVEEGHRLRCRVKAERLQSDASICHVRVALPTRSEVAVP